MAFDCSFPPIICGFISLCHKGAHEQFPPRTLACCLVVSLDEGGRARCDILLAATPDHGFAFLIITPMNDAGQFKRSSIPSLSAANCIVDYAMKQPTFYAF
jgi:hypothetical protein